MNPMVRILCACLSLMVFVSPSNAADDVIIRQFDDASGISGWRFDFGGVSHAIEFDGAQDANGNPASGSMKVTFGFNAAALHPSGQNKGAVTLDFPPNSLDGSAFLTMEMDVRIEPGSATDGGGNSGYLKMVIRNGNGYEYNSQFGSDVTTNSGWLHIAATVSGARDNIRAITIELYGGANLTGQVVFNVDNIKFTKPTSARDIFVSQFNNAAALDDWRFEYGGVTNLIEFDSSQDASNNPASGSMKTTFGFDSALNATDNNKGALTLDLASPIDASEYLSLEMDVKIAPGSAQDGSGNSGAFQLIVRYGDFLDVNPQFSGNLRISDGWRRIRVSPMVAPVNDIRAFTIELSGGATLTGPVTFHVDNLKFTSTNVPPPSPTMFVERPTRGLNLIPTSGQDQRQNIMATNGAGYGWLGSSEPVTYSLTVHRHPGLNHSGFQMHIFLVPGVPTDSAPDYHAPHVVFLDIQSRANGTAFAAFRYKINEPSGNAFLYAPAPAGGTLGGVNSATPLGTWSLTLSDDTNALVTASDGTTANFVIPPDAAAVFADPIAVLIGIQPNSGANIGHTVILSSARISRGSSILLEDDFLTANELDLQKWTVMAGNPIGVQLVGSDAAFWLSWTTPDSGAALQSTTNPGDPLSWANTGWTVPVMGTVKKVLVHYYNENPVPGRTYAPSPQQSFFRLLRP